jgi:hypothetical protein
MKGEVKADAQGLFIEPELEFKGLIFKAEASLGIGKSGKYGGKGADNIKNNDGIHYKAEGEIVAMDPYKWPLKDWRIPLLPFK